MSEKTIPVMSIRLVVDNPLHGDVHLYSPATRACPWSTIVSIKLFDGLDTSSVFGPPLVTSVHSLSQLLFG